MYAQELLAFEVARSKQQLRIDQHEALSREPAMYVRREWARRSDQPSQIATRECIENNDIVVRTRLSTLPQVSWAAALRHLLADGYIATASVAMRKDCPDDQALSLLRSLPVKKQIHQWHSVRLSAERTFQFGDRPHSAEHLFEFWMNGLPLYDLPELLHFLSDLPNREGMLDRVEARVRGSVLRSKTSLSLDRYGEDNSELWLLDFLHRVPRWVSGLLRDQISELPDELECAEKIAVLSSDRSLPDRGRWVWSATPAIVNAFGCLGDLVPIYNTESGIVFSRLLDTSRLSLGDVVLASHRLTPHLALAQFLERYPH
jgi:hypothetical protein